MVIQEGSSDRVFKIRRTGTDLRNNTVVRFVVDANTNNRLLWHTKKYAKRVALKFVFVW